jgi:DNA processing protein
MSLPTLHQNLILLKLIPRLGYKKIIDILQTESSISKEPLSDSYLALLLKNDTSTLVTIREHASKLMVYIKENDIKVVSVLDSRYPEALKRTFEPPPVLFYKGNIEYDYTRSIAVVGTRKFTSYGQESCENFVRELSKNRFTIISGLATGIDSIAHITALRNKTHCIGVIGHGFKFCFPSANKELYQAVLDNDGAIISEFLPDIRPERFTFPLRNKTIAGLARATLVVEAAEKSGSLITAHDAFAENRDVFAIPADTTRPSYQGCNVLIRSNIAKLVSKPDELLLDLGVSDSQKLRTPITTMRFSDVQKTFVDLVSMERLTSDEISNQLGMHITIINEILSELELMGVIIRDDEQRWMIGS